MVIYRFIEDSMQEVTPWLTLEMDIYNSAGIKTLEQKGEIKGVISNFEYLLKEIKFSVDSSDSKSESITEYKQFTWNEDSSQYDVKEIPIQETTPVAKTDQNKKAALPDNLFTYKGVGVGMSQQQVIKLIGTPEFKDPDPEGDSYENWVYGNYDYFVEFNTGNNKVVSITIPETANGIKEVDPYSKIVKLLGEGKIEHVPGAAPEYEKVEYKVDNIKKISFYLENRKVMTIMIGGRQ